MPMRGDLAQLHADIKYYRDKGYQRECEWAARHAQCATREFIERLHPATGFSGHSLHTAQVSKGTDNLIQKGSYKIIGNAVDANIYANYFARWYNTGVYIYGTRRSTEKGKRDYPNHFQAPRGSVFTSNMDAIKEYFMKDLHSYMQQIIKIRR